MELLKDSRNVRRGIVEKQSLVMSERDKCVNVCVNKGKKTPQVRRDNSWLAAKKTDGDAVPVELAPIITNN